MNEASASQPARGNALYTLARMPPTDRCPLSPLSPRLLASAMNAPSYSPLSLSTYLMMGGAGLAVLISLPMMLIGRAYDVEIKHIPKDLIR